LTDIIDRGSSCSIQAKERQAKERPVKERAEAARRSRRPRIPRTKAGMAGLPHSAPVAALLIGDWPWLE
jgi:hypothetical protein